MFDLRRACPHPTVAPAAQQRRPLREAPAAVASMHNRAEAFDQAAWRRRERGALGTDGVTFLGDDLAETAIWLLAVEASDARMHTGVDATQHAPRVVDLAGDPIRSGRVRMHVALDLAPVAVKPVRHH